MPFVNPEARFIAQDSDMLKLASFLYSVIASSLASSIALISVSIGIETGFAVVTAISAGGIIALPIAWLLLHDTSLRF